MTVQVAIVDYGIGNLLSVRRAFEHCGARVEVTDDPDVLLGAARMVVPGVGAFADGMRGLRERGLDRVIVEAAGKGVPVLGICLGMQVFATVSEEFGEHAGLDLIPGRVVPIPPTTLDGHRHKIPHTGWTALEEPGGGSDWNETILEDVEPGECVYLVHSFAVEPENPRHRLAECEYNGRRIAAAIRRDNVTGTQFHPEKSGPIGLKIIRRFLNEGCT